jgi:hypothetical protein
MDAKPMPPAEIAARLRNRSVGGYLPSLHAAAADCIDAQAAEITALRAENKAMKVEWAADLIRLGKERGKVEERAGRAVDALRKIARDRGGYMGEYHAECMEIASDALEGLTS